MRTIIAGSRKGFTYNDVVNAMNSCWWKPTEIVSGGAAGVDTFGEQWATDNNIPIKKFIPNWDDISVEGAVIRINKWGKKYNAMAGIDRNHQMGDYAEALVAVWDGKSTGTKDMIDYATELGLEVFIYKTK